MPNLFTSTQWLTWGTVTASQALVAGHAWKREKPLAAYLTILLSSSLAAMALIFLGMSGIYLRAYIAGGYLEMLATTAYVVYLANACRLCALPSKRGMMPLAILLLLASLLTWLFCRPPFVSNPTVLTPLRVHGFVVYTTLVFALSLLPIYALFALALPRWSKVLQIFGVCCAVALHASVIDHFLTFPGERSQIVKRAHDYAYLLPLSFWYVASKISSRTPTSKRALRQDSRGLE